MSRFCTITSIVCALGCAVPADPDGSTAFYAPSKGDRLSPAQAEEIVTERVTRLRLSFAESTPETKPGFRFLKRLSVGGGLLTLIAVEVGFVAYEQASDVVCHIDDSRDPWESAWKLVLCGVLRGPSEVLAQVERYQAGKFVELWDAIWKQMDIHGYVVVGATPEKVGGVSLGSVSSAGEGLPVTVLLSRKPVYLPLEMVRNPLAPEALPRLREMLVLPDGRIVALVYGPQVEERPFWREKIRRDLEDFFYEEADEDFKRRLREAHVWEEGRKGECDPAKAKQTLDLSKDGTYARAIVVACSDSRGRVVVSPSLILVATGVGTVPIKIDIANSFQSTNIVEFHRPISGSYAETGYGVKLLNPGETQRNFVPEVLQFPYIITVHGLGGHASTQVLPAKQTL